MSADLNNQPTPETSQAISTSLKSAEISGRASIITQAEQVGKTYSAPGIEARERYLEVQGTKLKEYTVVITDTSSYAAMRDQIAEAYKAQYNEKYNCADFSSELNALLEKGPITVTQYIILNSAGAPISGLDFEANVRVEKEGVVSYELDSSMDFDAQVEVGKKYGLQLAHPDTAPVGHYLAMLKRSTHGFVNNQGEPLSKQEIGGLNDPGSVANHDVRYNVVKDIDGLSKTVHCRFSNLQVDECLLMESDDDLTAIYESVTGVPLA